MAFGPHGYITSYFAPSWAGQGTAAAATTTTPADSLPPFYIGKYLAWLVALIQYMR